MLKECLLTGRDIAGIRTKVFVWHEWKTLAPKKALQTFVKVRDRAVVGFKWYVSILFFCLDAKEPKNQGCATARLKMISLR